MKKNRLFMTGTLAVMLAFGLFLAGCKTDADDDGGDGGPGGGGVPEELVGKWVTAEGVSAFQITSANKLILSGTYDASVSGKTVSVKFLGQDQGKFDYELNEDEMTLSNCTIIFEGWEGETLKKRKES